jgi:hypothetical protein
MTNYSTNEDQNTMESLDQELTGRVISMSRGYNTDELAKKIELNPRTFRLKNEYISLQNERLQRDISKLINIQNRITTQDRAIEQINNHTNRENIVYRTLLYFIVILPFIGGAILAFYAGKMTMKTLLTTCLIVFGLYGSYVWYIIRATRDPSWKKDALQRKVIDDLKGAGDYIYKEGRKLESKYIDDNCDCPKKSGKGGGKGDQMGIGPDAKNFNRGNGYYYYNDGSAPNQIISSLQENNYEIEWITDQNTGGGFPDPTKRY